MVGGPGRRAGRRGAGHHAGRWRVRRRFLNVINFLLFNHSTGRSLAAEVPYARLLLASTAGQYCCFVFLTSFSKGTIVIVELSIGNLGGLLFFLGRCHQSVFCS